MPTFGQLAKQRASQMTTSPIQVEVQARLGLSCEEAFRYVTDATKLVEWLPVGKRSYSDDSRAETPGQVGSVRVIHSGPTPPTRERVVGYDAGSFFYAYSAPDSALLGTCRDHLGVITLEPHPEGGSVITWLAYGRPSRSYVMRYLGLRMFRFVLGGGIKNLEKRFPVGR